MAWSICSSLTAGKEVNNASSTVTDKNFLIIISLRRQ